AGGSAVGRRKVQLSRGLAKTGNEHRRAGHCPSPQSRWPHDVETVPSRGIGGRTGGFTPRRRAVQARAEYRLGLFVLAVALSDLREVAVPTETTLEARRSRNAVFDQRFASVVPLLDQRTANRESVTLDRRPAGGAHADLRESSNLLRQFFRLCACASFGSHVLAETNVQTFFRRHLPSGQNDFQCAPLADDARQAHRSAIDQRHTPATAIDAEIGF